MEETKFLKVADGINKFYSSTKSIYIFCGIATVVGLVQIIAFAMGALEINGTLNDATSSQAQKLWAWFAITISIINCYVSFYMCILNSRGDSSFLWWAVGMNVLTFIVNAMASMWMLNLQIIIVIPLVFIRYYVWEHKLYEEGKFSFKNCWWWLYIISVVLVVIFILIVFLWGEQIYAGGINDGKKMLWYFDTISAALQVIANTLLIFKVRQAYLWMELSKIPFIALYIQSGNIVPTVQQLIYFTMDCATVLAWTAQLKRGNAI